MTKSNAHQKSDPDRKIKIIIIAILAVAGVAFLSLYIMEQRAERAHQLKVAGDAARRMIGWRSIEGGRFLMGSDSAGENTRPAHAVQISKFLLSRTEVTVSQYKPCVEVGICKAPGEGEECNWGRKDRREHPVNCLSWDDARVFAQWIGGDLPTEAEWEFAARSRGIYDRFPWGDEQPSCRYAVMNDGGHGCGKGSTAEVCSRQQGHSKEELCDMIGNVSEWVRDSYYESYEGAPRDGRPYCSQADCSERRGYRISRGGSWYEDEIASLDAIYREREPSYGRYFYLGFRVRRDP